MEVRFQTHTHRHTHTKGNGHEISTLALDKAPKVTDEYFTARTKENTKYDNQMTAKKDTMCGWSKVSK